MSSNVEVTKKLKRNFANQYATFLFAPKFIQDVLYIDSKLRQIEPPGSHDIILNIHELCDKVIEGVERSFLILGDSGSGKTSFALKLCQTLWGKSGLGDKTLIPIYVYLPPLVAKLNKDESEFNFVKTLVEEFGVNGIQECEGQIVFILDSFDEISSFAYRSKIIQNIWTNTSEWSADVSILTCSRPEGVPKLERQDMFEFIKFGHVGNRKYLEYTLEGLSENAISCFLDKMEIRIIPQLRSCKDEELLRWSAWGILKSKVQDWKLGDYNQWFKDLPDLKKLSESPYILTLICQALPGIVLKLKHESKALKKLCRTRVGIFRSFTEQIFEYQAERVSQRPVNLKPGAQTILYRDWLIYFRAYAQNLAGKWFTHVNPESIVKISDDETLDSSLIEPVLNITQLEKLEKDHNDLFPPRLTHYEETECRTVANARNEMQIENMKILRDACNGSILVYSANDNEYTFIHRSMLEYFASEQAFESSLAEYDLILCQHIDNPSAIYGKTGFGRVLIKDRDILSQLVERMSIEYKKILFKLIRVSKEVSQLHRISANAITILNKAHVCFSGQDYRDVQIQGADLRQSICAHTDFRGANLTNVLFGDSYLIGAQFQGACMEGIDFGESPLLKLSAELNSITSYREEGDTEDTWVIATADGAVRIWNALDEKLVLPPCRYEIYTIHTRLSLLDGKLAVWDLVSSSERPKIPLFTKMSTCEVTFYALSPKWKFFKKHSFQTTEGVDQVYVEICSVDKCVFIYSACHLEVLSYLPKPDSNAKSLIRIGDGDPNTIFRFVSIVDKNGDILVARHEKSKESIDGRIIVYKYNEGCHHFQVIQNITPKPFSDGEGELEFVEYHRILFKPGGSGLVIYHGPGTNLQVFENYSEVTTPIHKATDVFIGLAFDKTGKYLAGLALASYKITIWNIPSGTIYRQFEISAISFTSHRVSNPLAFSSDSKVLAFCLDESISNQTVKLKLIDENPSIRDLSIQKYVDDVAVSDDGQMVVICGNYHHTGYSNYAEIFNFPFQSSTGLYVRFPEDIEKDICSIGIINSKQSVNFKKIIVIQEAHCRVIVICSNTGNILQNFRFEETLDVRWDHLCCVNKQTTLCCIYSQPQGYLFWEIFENNNFEVVFQRRTDLEFLSETDVKVGILRFDNTGRHLQLVSDPLIDEESSKTLLFDTKEKIVKTINVPLNADPDFPFYSVDTDMPNNIIFSCSHRQLLIFDPSDPILSEQVDFMFNYESKLYFDPLSGWLFATCLDNCSVGIFQRKECEWGIVLKIPLWFKARKCVIYEKNNKISVLISGKYDLCYIEFDKENCHSWRFLWSMKHCHELTSLNSNVDGALQLSRRNAGVLKGLGAIGTSLQNIKSQYLPFRDWCQEIFGTARSKFHSPFIKTTESNFALSEDMWVVSLVGNLSHILSWRAHVYFIVEGIKNNRRFITRIHLTYSKKLKEVSIVVSPVVDRTPINDHSWEESKYIEFIDLADKLSAQQYGMSKKDCEQFLRNIQSSMQVKLDYNLLFNNCAVWCEEELKKVGREVHLEGFTSALVFPRVSKLMNGMKFWKKSKKKVYSECP